MGHEDRRATAQQPPERAPERGFGLRIDGTRGFVHDEHRTICEERTGDGDELSLAPRELESAFSQPRVVALRESGDELVSVGRLRSGDGVVSAGPAPGAGDVLGDADREQDRIPRDDRKLAAEILEPIVAEIDAIELDLARLRVSEAREHVDPRALGDAGGPHDSQVHARLDGERDVLHDRPVLAEGAGDVVEDDGAAGAFQGPGVRSLFDVRRPAEQGEGPIRPGHMPLEAGDLPTDGAHRAVELDDVRHDHQQLSQGELARPHV